MLTLLLFAGVAFDFGLYLVTLREISGEASDQARIMGNAVALRATATTFGIALLAAGISFTRYDDTIVQGVLIAGIGWVGFQLNSLLRAVFQAKLAKHLGAVAETAGATLTLVLVIVLAALGAEADAMLAATAAGFLCMAGMSWYSANRLMPFRPKFELRIWRRLLILGLPVAASVVLFNVQLRADVLLLSLLRDSHDVGLYDAPLKIYELMFIIPYLFGGMITPLFVRDLERDGVVDIGSRLSAALGICTIISTLFFAVMLVNAEPVVVLLGGEQFAESATPLRILAGAAIFVGMAAVLRFAATALSQNARMLRADVIGTITAIGAHVVLIPEFGIIGAACGKLLGDFVTCGAAMFMLRAQLQKSMLISLAVAIVGGAALYAMLTATTAADMNWIASTLICGLAVSGALLLLAPVRRGLAALSSSS